MTVEHSVITCPHCGAAKRETMPADASQIFYNWLRLASQTKSGRLLRFLFTRLGALSVDPGATSSLCGKH